MVGSGSFTPREKGWTVIKKIVGKSEKRILAQKIVQIENALGITGKELSRISGVSDATIYRIKGSIESDAGVSEKMLMKIAEATEVDLDWLMDPSADRIGDIVWKNKEAHTIGGGRRIAAGEGASGDPVEEAPEMRRVFPSDAGERVRSLRLGLSLTQEHFAKPLDITQGHLALIERGRTKLTERMACKIEETYEDAGAEWLLTGNDRNRVCPVDDKMIEWLKNHQRVREKIKIWMDGEDNGENDA